MHSTVPLQQDGRAARKVPAQGDDGQNDCRNGQDDGENLAFLHDSISFCFLSVENDRLRIASAGVFRKCAAHAGRLEQLGQKHVVAVGGL